MKRLFAIGLLGLTLTGCGVAAANVSNPEVITLQDEFDAMEDNFTANANYWNQQLGTTLTADNMVGNKEAIEMLREGGISEVHFVNNGKPDSVKLSEVAGYSNWQITLKEVYESFVNLPEDGPERSQLIEQGEARLVQDFEGMAFLSVLDNHAALKYGDKLFVMNAK